MTIQTSTIRPGLLVSLKTSVLGNALYERLEIEADHLTQDGARKARWETERTISDPVEHEAAIKVRSKARSLIKGVCAHSAFGLLCPETASYELEEAIADARRIVDQFNATAKLTRISIYVIAGRIAQDDVEAVKAINSEVRDLLDDMQRGVQGMDVQVIREAAGKARSLGSMLSPDAQARIQIAIDAARETARKIVKAGEQAAQEIDTRTLQTLKESRTAFLDMDAARAVAAPQVSGRAIDMGPSDGSEDYGNMARGETARAIARSGIDIEE